MDESLKLKVIKPGVIISMDVSSNYNQAIVSIMQYLIVEKCYENDVLDQTKLDSAYEQIKLKDVKEPWVQHLNTLAIFVGEFEKKALEGGHVSDMEDTED